MSRSIFILLAGGSAVNVSILSPRYLDNKTLDDKDLDDRDLGRLKCHVSSHLQQAIISSKLFTNFRWAVPARPSLWYLESGLEPSRQTRLIAIIESSIHTRMYTYIVSAPGILYPGLFLRPLIWLNWNPFGTRRALRAAVRPHTHPDRYCTTGHSRKASETDGIDRCYLFLCALLICTRYFILVVHNCPLYNMHEAGRDRPERRFLCWGTFCLGALFSAPVFVGKSGRRSFQVGKVEDSTPGKTGRTPLLVPASLWS